MRIVLIAAVADDGAIGIRGDIPWHLPADLAFFYQQIEGCLLLTGRRSLESPQGREMFTPDRKAIVVSRQPDYQAPKHVHLARSVEDALAWAAGTGAPRLCVLGGADIYRQTMPYAHELIITHVRARFPQADSFFPPIDPAIWQVTWQERHTRDAQHPWDYEFVRYERLEKVKREYGTPSE